MPLGDAVATVRRQPEEAVNIYLDGFYSGDHARARTVVAPDFAFQGPFLSSDSSEAYFTEAAGLGRIVRGHRVLNQWVNGNEVATFYEVSFGSGDKAVRMAEWHTVADGLITAARLIFDTAAFRQAVG